MAVAMTVGLADLAPGGRGGPETDERDEITMLFYLRRSRAGLEALIFPRLLTQLLIIFSKRADLLIILSQRAQKSR